MEWTGKGMGKLVKIILENVFGYRTGYGNGMATEIIISLVWNRYGMEWIVKWNFGQRRMEKEQRYFFLVVFMEWNGICMEWNEYGIKLNMQLYLQSNQQKKKCFCVKNNKTIRLLRPCRMYLSLDP